MDSKFSFYVLSVIALIISMTTAITETNFVTSLSTAAVFTCLSSHSPVWNKLENGGVRSLAFGVTKFKQFTDTR